MQDESEDDTDILMLVADVKVGGNRLCGRLLDGKRVWYNDEQRDEAGKGCRVRFRESLDAGNVKGSSRGAC